MAIHVAANLYGSLRHCENLVRSMITGRKPALDERAPQPGTQS